VSGTTPTFGAILFTAAFNDNDESSLIASATNRCARSRSSSGYFLGAGITPPFRGITPSTKPGAVHGAELYGAARKLCPTCWPVRRDAYIRQLSHSPALPSASEPAAADQFSGGITLEQYRTQILPALTHVPLPRIERATVLTNGSCSRLRAGHQIPHPLHWAALATLSRQTASEPDGPSTA